MQQPKLTFIHGFMGHPSHWDDVRSALPEFDTCAVEIQPAADWQSSIKQLTKTISPNSIIVGYSMGARLALGVAIEAPQCCKGLIFVSGNPGLETEADREARWRSDQQVAEQIESGSQESFLNGWYQAKVFEGMSEEVRRSEIARKLARSSSNWPGILRANSVSRQPNYWRRLSELKMPTLVVAGERDEKYKNIANRICQTASSPKVSATIVPDSGHIVHREQPTAFIKIVHEFVVA